MKSLVSFIVVISLIGISSASAESFSASNNTFTTTNNQISTNGKLYEQSLSGLRNYVNDIQSSSPDLYNRINPDMEVRFWCNF